MEAPHSAPAATRGSPRTSIGAGQLRTGTFCDGATTMSRDMGVKASFRMAK